MVSRRRRRTGLRWGMLAAAMTLLLGSGRRAWAGPPFVTDDPEPVELHHWEVYFASMYWNGRDGAFGTAPHAEVNYGAVPNLQLHLIAPLAFSAGSGGAYSTGFGDTELGVKYRFIEETKRRPMVGIFPLIEVPTGDRTRGLGSGHVPVFLPIWIQKSWGPWTTYGGGGYWSNPGDGARNYWLSGWLIQREVSKHLTVGGEIYHQTRVAVDDPDQFHFNLGGQYNFDEGHHLLFSAGHSLGAYRGPTEFSAYLAYQWTFGPKDTKEGDGKAAAPHERSSNRAPTPLHLETGLRGLGG